MYTVYICTVVAEKKNNFAQITLKAKKKNLSALGLIRLTFLLFSQNKLRFSIKVFQLKYF